MYWSLLFVFFTIGSSDGLKLKPASFTPLPCDINPDTCDIESQLKYNKLQLVNYIKKTNENINKFNRELLIYTNDTEIRIDHLEARLAASEQNLHNSQDRVEMVGKDISNTNITIILVVIIFWLVLLPVSTV